MRKKVDPRIQTLMNNCIALNQRGIFVIIGDKGRDQVVNIHFLMTKLSLRAKPKVLWCYKKDLGFTTHQRKREKQLKKQQQTRSLNEDELSEPFTLFLSSQQIRYCYYADTHRILGNTYNLLVLQDYEALTPNTLCRTIETVEGGGLVVFLLKTMSSLKQLYSMVMDVHSRFRTHAFQDVQPRFNERFILSLSTLGSCLFMDDELNLLPVSTHEIVDVVPTTKSSGEMQTLIDSMKGGHEIIYQLVSLCKTVDQARVVMGLVDCFQEKIFRYTVSVTAARGRGKSAAIGMAAAAAIAMGSSNVFITAPSPENLPTFFEFLVKGLEALGMKENQHFDIIQSTNPEFNKAVVRVNIYKTHRQYVQYVLPADADKVQGQADLLLVDEAAAIPLPFVRRMFGPYTLVMSSTVNGYEGTGRSLSLKLVQRLREQNIQQSNKPQEKAGNGSARMFKEFAMSDPIRYAANDPIERWLYDLLLLDATEAQKLTRGLPHPTECELYLVNRDTLFSYQKGSEKFLRSLMSLFIASHYKNSPNDMQLLSDAPAHAVFVLLGPLHAQQKGESSLPDILCVIQVCLEGQIPQNIVDKNSDKQLKPAGDLVPWTLSKFFLDDHFPSLSGARVVRIATHPSAQTMGYGTKAMELLFRFFQGQLLSRDTDTPLVSMDLHELYQQPTDEDIKTKKKLPPLLRRLAEVIPPQLNYIGVCFGLTKEIYKFWLKSGFSPAYLSLRKNDVTGEYSCIVVRALSQDEDQNESTNIIAAFAKDFRSRFVNLLSYDFQDLDQFLCLELLQPNLSTQQDDKLDLDVAVDPDIVKKEELACNFSLQDLQRLDQYCRNLADFYLILDILPYICGLFFTNKTGKAVRMSKSQAAILVAMGLQRLSVEKASVMLSIEVNQILPLFNKALRKLKTFIKGVFELQVEKRLFKKDQIVKKIEQKQLMNPIKNDISKELHQAGQKYLDKIEGNDKGRQKRGKTNYELDDIEEGNVVVNNPDSKVVTIARTLGDAKFSHNKQGNKKVKQ